jgi:hypothetical protein
MSFRRHFSEPRTAGGNSRTGAVLVLAIGALPDLFARADELGYGTPVRMHIVALITLVVACGGPAVAGVTSTRKQPA